jgi:carboxyl-terminal processing protease
LRVVDGQLLVWRVRADGPAARAGVRPGWIIRAIDGCTVTVGGGASAGDGQQEMTRPERARAAERAMRSLRGVAGSTAQVDVADGADRLRHVTLARVAAPGHLAELPNLPPAHVAVEWSRERTLAGRVAGVVRFDAWYPVIARDLAAAIDSLRDTDGMILDLRGNTGGVAAMYPWLAGYFVPGRSFLGAFVARGARQALCAVPVSGPDSSIGRVRYLHPLAILIDGHSHSTTEMFVASLQAVGRARVFGETSLGGVVGAMYDRLPNGDVFEHPVVDFVTATGSRPEGAGVVPDDVAPARRADLLAGRDAAMDAALHWLDREKGGAGWGGDGLAPANGKLSLPDCSASSRSEP